MRARPASGIREPGLGIPHAAPRFLSNRYVILFLYTVAKTDPIADVCSDAIGGLAWLRCAFERFVQADA